MNDTKTTALGDGLRALAAMIDANPDLVKDAGLHWWFNNVNVPVSSKDHVPALARAGMKAGAKVTKHQNDKYAGVDVTFGAVGLHVYIDREEICERIVTGTREVVEEVPDPDALAKVRKIAVKKTVEDVEWRCRPLLGDEPEPVEFAPGELDAVAPDAPSPVPAMQDAAGLDTREWGDLP